MTVSRAQQQAVFALKSGTHPRGMPFPFLSLSGEDLTILVSSNMEQPFRVTVDPSGAIVGLESQSAVGHPEEGEPWTDILSNPNGLQYRYFEFFSKMIAEALTDSVAADASFDVALPDLPASVAELTTIPADALAALADPGQALTVAQVAAHPKLVEELAEALHVIDQTDPLSPTPRKPWQVLDHHAKEGCRRCSRAILTAIATTGSPFTVSLPGMPQRTRQAAYAVMLFTQYWAKR
jgi:hypothetical protein